MPESPEIRIMSDYLNKEFKNRIINKIEKNPNSKNNCDLSILEGKSWKIFSKARGKEMMLIFLSNEIEHRMKISFGRIGSISHYPIDSIDEIEFNRKAMLRFYTEDNVYFLSDFTKYSLWRWANEWDKNRSPDIMTEHNEWRKHIYKHRNSKYFTNYIYDILTDQKFFNGIGNFSRSEILCRTRFSPFTKFNEILKAEMLREDFFITCKDVLEQIYYQGGLQCSNWKNPDGISKHQLDKWIICYNKPSKANCIKDSGNAQFWYRKIHKFKGSTGHKNT